MKRKQPKHSPGFKRKTKYFEQWYYGYIPAKLKEIRTSKIVV